MKTEDLSRAIEEIDDMAWEALVSPVPGAWHRRDGGARRTYSGLPMAYFNRVSMTTCEPAGLGDLIDRCVTEFAETGMPWHWAVGPHCPPELPGVLESKGFVFGYHTPAMAADLTRWNRQARSLDVRPVKDFEQFEDWLAVAAPGFGLPPSVTEFMRTSQKGHGFADSAPMRHFTAYEDGMPVACATVVYGAGLAGVYTVATLPGARGKGFGCAVTEACMQDALDRGVDTAMLFASKMGYPVYRKLGFEDVYQVAAYALP